MGAVTGSVLAGVSPHYRSQATIQVAPPRISGDVVAMPAAGHLEDRLAAVQQSVLTRTRLERLMIDLNLFETERRHGVIMQELVERMVRDINIAVEPSRFGGQPSAFVVAYTARDPRAAQRVAEQLAGFVISESLKHSARFAENTLAFLESQIQATGKRLAEHDERLAAAPLAGGRDSARMQIEAEVMRSNYKSLLEKREQAVMRVHLERSQVGEQFVLLEQARLPERPEGPTRNAAAFAGGLAGLVLALAVNLFFAIRRALAARATAVARA
jgi:uncharacterized protein involved in exopolysaccharide biosynthesis